MAGLCRSAVRRAAPALTTILSLFAGAAFGAQQAPVARVELISAYTDNLFQSYTKRSDWIQSLTLDLDHALGDLGLYYSGQARMFAEYEDLFAQNHAVGVSIVRPGPERRLLAGGLSAAFRRGRLQYEYRDYHEIDGYLGVREYLQPTLMLRAGVSGAVRRYRQAPDFSFFEPAAYVQISRFLHTRTTLQGGIDLGAKFYLNESTGDPLYTEYARSSDPGSQLLAILWLKLAQSVGPRTGLQLRLSRQDILAGVARYQRPDLYDPVDELFDDAYSYASDEIRTTLKHKGAAGLELLATASYERRRYKGRPALSLDGLPLADGEIRRDDRSGVLLRAERSLGWTPRALSALSLRVEWSLGSVGSNDPYYAALTQMYSARLRLGL